ncbi:heat shock 70 kDa protein 12A-like isoform X1 [Dreissena polymorpha]|uniref:Uncharacterized protein n=1 Tax=Dreissena polymorpha TaxID=45954 RepID=A0A9D4DBB3_DREPO|nr:heat shock 70 kDa protein 12A-like isoform X1 [Dreissena polymorpha]KAH3746492.1 hypothetical protein DPMN_180900 [Dreissena polymorpha]
MELSVIRTPDLVVAIDVGSTYSGYAWQWRTNFSSNKQNVEFNTNWGQGTPQIHKTNTAILLKDDSTAQFGLKIVTFGYRAEHRYATICSDGKEKEEEYHLFKRFKLLLYRVTGRDGEQEPGVEDSNGILFKLSDIMALFIKAMKEDFYTKQSTTQNITNVLWVLTVPAIWSEKAKQFMRLAAEQAGIERKHLLLASEPEAAAIYCLNLPPEQQAAMNNVGTPGHCFLTVDLGGGTADLSAVRVEEDGLLRELCCERGNLIGGQSVNDAFFQACNDDFEGTEWKKKFTEATPFEMMKIEHEFEKCKLAIGAEEMDETIQLPLPRSVRDSFRTGKIKVNRSQTRISITGEEDLRFETSFVRDHLFDQACKMINQVIETVLENQKDIQTVVLVGGFAESPIVQENIKSLLQQKYPSVAVVVPTSPFRAVLMGAVLYGHDMFIYRSRVSRATYGVKGISVFDEKKHDESKKWFNTDTGINYCKDIFDIHVEKGQSVVLKEQTGGKNYIPLYKNQKSITLPLFVADTCGPSEGNVMYTTHPSCKKVGEIRVDLSDTDAPNSERKVCVKMIYGGSQLSVIATELTTGKEYNAEIHFNA